MFFPSVRYSLPDRTFSFPSEKKEDKEGPYRLTFEKADSGTLTPPKAVFKFKSKLFNICTHHTEPTVHHFHVQCYKLYHYFYYFQITLKSLMSLFCPWLLLVLKKILQQHQQYPHRRISVTACLKQHLPSWNLHGESWSGLKSEYQHGR